jgi:AAHS family 3-hydroxyphenylpropionic acid transporter
MPGNARTATHWPRIMLLWLCGVLAAMQFAKISVAFQQLQALYTSTAATMGLVLSTVGMVGLVFGVTAGLFAPAIGYRRLLLAGMALGALTSGLQAMLPPLWVFFATRVLEGASQLAVVVAAPTLIVASCGPAHKSIAMGLWSTFVGVAFAIAAAIGPDVIAATGLSGFLLLHAIGMGLLLLVIVIAVPPDTRDRPHRWPKLTTLLARHAQTYAHLASSVPGLCFFCYTAMGVALLTLIPLYAEPGKVWLAIVLPLTVTAGTFSAGWVAQHWVSPLTLVRCAFCGVGMAAAGLWLCFALAWTIAPAAVALMYAAGVSGGAAYALIPYLSQESLVQARANGAVAQMGNLGSTTGPPLFAALSAAMGVAGLALLAMALAAMGTVIATRAMRRLR